MKSSEITLKMNGFLPLSDIQKMLRFTPIKTYRLFKKFVRENKLAEISGWIRRDNQILIDIAQFYTLLETHGYKNFLRDDFNRNQTISNDNQMKSNEINYDENSEENSDDDESLLKSNEINTEELKSSDFNRNQMNTSENQNSTNNDVKLHREIIDTLRDSLDRSEREAEILREQVRNLSSQNKDLSRQNVQLTYVLVAPKKDGKDENDDKARPDYGEHVKANSDGETMYASPSHTEQKNTHLSEETIIEDEFQSTSLNSINTRDAEQETKQNHDTNENDTNTGMFDSDYLR